MAQNFNSWETNWEIPFAETKNFNYDNIVLVMQNSITYTK